MASIPESLLLSTLLSAFWSTKLLLERPIKLCSVFRSSNLSPKLFYLPPKRQEPYGQHFHLCSSVPTFSTSGFSPCHAKIPDRADLRSEGIVSLIVPRILPIMEGRPGSRSHCIQSQVAASEECLSSACFLLSIQF